MVGLSEVIGSWKTPPRWTRRTARRADSPPVSMSVPATVRVPRNRGSALSGSRPSIDMARTLLPDPDSPTMPRTSPGRTSRLTPRSTADRWRFRTRLTSRSRTVTTDPVSSGGRRADGAGSTAATDGAEDTADLPSREAAPSAAGADGGDVRRCGNVPAGAVTTCPETVTRRTRRLGRTPGRVRDGKPAGNTEGRRRPRREIPATRAVTVRYGAARARRPGHAAGP